MEVNETSDSRSGGGFDDVQLVVELFLLIKVSLAQEVFTWDLETRKSRLTGTESEASVLFEEFSVSDFDYPSAPMVR
jgi:hypothetical protein